MGPGRKSKLLVFSCEGTIIAVYFQTLVQTTRVKNAKLLVRPTHPGASSPIPRVAGGSPATVTVTAPTSVRLRKSSRSVMT